MLLYKMNATESSKTILVCLEAHFGALSSLQSDSNTFPPLYLSTISFKI